MKKNHNLIHLNDKKILGEVAMWSFNRNEPFLLLIKKNLEILDDHPFLRSL